MSNEPQANIYLPLKHTFLDYPDPTARALVIYFAGCEHDCMECQNPSLRINKEDIEKKIHNIKLSYVFNVLIHLDSRRHKTNFIALSGGDPLSSFNVEFVRQLLNLSSNKYNFCIYTGYDIEYVKKLNLQGFKFVKTGQFNKNLKQNSEKTDEKFVLASSNQKLYNSKYELLTDENGIYYFNRGE